MTPEDRRAAALSLIAHRGQMQLHDIGMLKRLHEAAPTDDDRIKLLHDILDLFLKAARNLRTKDSRVLLYATLAQLKGYHRSADDPVAATLIVSHFDVYLTDTDVIDDDVRADVIQDGLTDIVRSAAAAEFEKQAQYIGDHDRFSEITLNVISIWLQMLPELTSEAGLAWLRKLAEED